jgi:SAM-dependent MidA family methyltransferase
MRVASKSHAVLTADEVIDSAIGISIFSCTKTKIQEKYITLSVSSQYEMKCEGLINKPSKSCVLESHYTHLDNE